MSMHIEREDVAQLTREGLSVAQIADRLGCCERTVNRIRRETGTAVGYGPARLTPERLAEARRMFEGGASQREVARTIGTKVDTLRRHFPGQGWTHAQGGQYGQMVHALNRIEVFR